jgi:integral membrane protein
MLQTFRRFEATRPFTEAEAWLLFRIAAVAEACGWTLLIGGVLADRYVPRGGGSALLLAGRTHGMLFFLYCMASLGLYPSLGWSRWRGLFALAFSVPPYGSLLFEQWAAAKRHNAGFRTYRQYLIYNCMASL